ncbi:MAG: hypothetical protein ACRD4G_00915 [Bryobacteraceae bacterium]
MKPLTNELDALDHLASASMSLERAVANASTAPGSGRGSLRYWRPVRASLSTHDGVAFNAGGTAVPPFEAADST